MYRSKHFRHFLVICMACILALSVFLTIFLAYDNAQMRRFQLLPDFDKMKNEVEEQQAEDGLVNPVPELKQLSKDIDKATDCAML